MKRRILSLLVVLTLIFTFCMPVMAAAEKAPKLTIWGTVDTNLNATGFSSYNEAPGFKAWQEATGIQVEMVEAADQAALLLMLAGDELPDIIRAPKTFYPKGHEAMIEEGLAIVLDEYMPEYAPNYWAYINSSENIFNSATVEVDGKLSSIAFAGNFYPETSPYRNFAGMFIRKDYLDKLGMEPITTVDEFYTYLSRCKNELGVKTPLIAEAYQFRYLWEYGYLTSGFGLVSGAGYHVDGQYHFGAYEPEFKDVLVFLNKLYNEGLIDPNFTVTDNATAVAAMSSGDSSVMCGMISRYQVCMNAATEEGYDLVGIPSLAANKGERAKMSYASTISSPDVWCYITEECDDIESALKFLDYLFTPEGADLANYGIEGVTFEYDAEGKAQFTEFVTNNPDGIAIDPFTRSYGQVNWPCVHRQEFSEKRFPLAQQREGCVAWANSDYNDYMIQNYSVPIDLQEEHARLWTDLDTYMKEAIANFIAGTDSLDNFDNYIATLKSIGMDRYIEIMQIAIDPYYNK